MPFDYPIFEVDLTISVRIDALSWPDAGEASNESCLGCNRSYSDLRRLPWKEAKRVFELETELIARIETANDSDAQYEQIEDELLDYDLGLYGLDIGVASSTIALSAARCTPFSSCNAGSFGGDHYEKHPLVAFFAKRELVDLLIYCARTAGVGLTNSHGGSLIVYATDIRNMRTFAEQLISRKTEFNAIQIARPSSSKKTAQRSDQLKLL